MDKFALLRAFSNELGITPHAYQIQVRMARACRLIAQGVPLAEVAHKVGYSEQSALHRPFKRRIGVTPGAYARALGENVVNFGQYAARYRMDNRWHERGGWNAHGDCRSWSPL